MSLIDAYTLKSGSPEIIFILIRIRSTELS